MKVPAKKRWRLFEKLVAAIHRVEQRGAEVCWNSKINGRQFDVTVRFKAGNYSYLTVIECKDLARSVEVGAVEAFVTKSRRAKANKAIMVASHGFQSGCFEEAEISGIELFTLEEIDELPPGAVDVGLIPALNFRSFKLTGPEGELQLPEHRNILPFLLKETIISNHRGRCSIEAMLEQRHDEFDRKASTEPIEQTVPFNDKTTTATLPDIISGNTLERITLPVDSLSFELLVIPARGIRNSGLDPYIHLGGAYQYRNSVTGDHQRYGTRDLNVAAETEFKEGCFYAAIFTDFRYYCHGVADDKITMTMLEGYQHGRHLQATFIVLRENATNYLEIADSSEIERLQAMVESLERIGGPL